MRRLVFTLLSAPIFTVYQPQGQAEKFSRRVVGIKILITDIRKDSCEESGSQGFAKLRSVPPLCARNKIVETRCV